MAEQLVTRRDNKDQLEEMTWVLSKFDQVRNLWVDQNLNFLVPIYGEERENGLALESAVFNYDTPQNFRITSRGASGQNFHIIETIFYDPHSAFNRVFKQMAQLKKKSSYQALTQSDPGYQEIMYESDTVLRNQMASPFIIYWKDVN